MPETIEKERNSLYESCAIGYEYGKTPVQSGAARLGAEGLQFSIPLPIVTGWGIKSTIKLYLVRFYLVKPRKTIKLREQPKTSGTHVRVMTSTT